ncbi:Gfo/Idh/MocA family protein [Rubrimonas cliftonensis]|uniref:Predicted dehydrogenase n=1 Tax=Rubrimonas cliftonensis TaxID=89524 RepID=A0A1H4CWC8_9RHOB|nr:Gfo/Idh/MocA family oxidoreductase [Rubrimonas cliftonensis]SEA64536.1 Predicted dehydrogenase [Rubrimonas cliftonensis]
MSAARGSAAGPDGVTRVGVIGCGYVFDHYMTTWSRHPRLRLAGVADRDAARAARVGAFYGLRVYPDNAALLADPEIDLVMNLTSIESHVEVTRAALEAGKHVYSEKPLTTDLAEARALAALAESRGLALSCAPSNALGDTAQTLWKAVRDGAVGRPRLVYAEFDDNPIYLMSPEGWRSRSGAPWPYIHEYEQGCTYEHVGYHLTWMCAIFGPVRSVTAFSAVTVPDKTDHPLDPPDTPDFSVACLAFESGVVGRVTCSIAAPLDHSARIVGDKGMLRADTYRHYRCPVYLERFSKLSLNARKAQSVRRSPLLQALFGVGGRRLKLARNPPPGESVDPGDGLGPWWSPRAALTRLRRRELGQQDKCVGVAELAAALRAGRPWFPAPDFTLHLTELTIAIQGARADGAPRVLTTRFEPPAPTPATLSGAPDYGAGRPGLAARLSEKLLDRLHRH